MTKLITYTINLETECLTVEKFLRKEGYSKHIIIRLKNTDRGISVNGELSYTTRLLKERKIHRQYLAIATGQVLGKQTVTAPIARVEGSTIERCVDFERGEYARTHCRSLFYNQHSDCTLLAVVLDTGRTHQIRVHMKHIGHPLPGDFLYHPDYRYIHRQALHSHLLTFIHPLTKKELQFEAPLPDDMQFIYPPELSRS